MKKKKTRKERLKKAFVKIIDENTVYDDHLLGSHEELADKLVAKIIEKGMLKGEKNMRPL